MKSKANAANRLSGCLERALETHAERVILDLRGLDRLDLEAVSSILIAHLIAESEHRQLLLIPGSANVQRVLDQVQGPFSYLERSDDSSLRCEQAGRAFSPWVTSAPDPGDGSWTSCSARRTG
jgi:hypothetical protein